MTKENSADELIIFRALIDTMNEGFAVVDHDNNLTYVNSRFLEMLGYERNEMIGHPVTEFVNEENAAILKEEIQKRKEKLSSKYELTWTRKDGSGVLTLVSGAPLVDEQGEHIGSFAVIADLTEIRRFIDAVERTEEKYRNLVENSLQGIAVIQNGRYVYVNPAFARIVGYSVQEILAMSKREAAALLYPEDRDILFSHGAEKSDDERGHILEHRLIRKDGTIRHVQSLFQSIEYEGHEALQIFAIDVTERKRIETELRESQHILQMVINNIPLYVFWKNRNSEYMGCNYNFAIVSGAIKPENIIGKTDYDLSWPRSSAEAFRKTDKNIIEKREAIVHSIEQLEFADTTMWIDITKVPLIDENNQVIGVLGVFEDISERMQVQQKIKMSEERYKALADFSLQGIAIITRKGFAYVNNAFANIVGRSKEELLAMSLDEIRKLVHPSDLPDIERRVAAWFNGEQVPPKHEYRFVRKNGDIRWVESFTTRVYSDGEPALQTVFIDTTERKRIEREVHTERDRALLYLDLMGHDLRNQLQIILNSATLMREIQDEQMRDNFLEVIKNSIQRSARLIGEIQETEQLLTTPLRKRNLIAALTTCIAALEGRLDTEFHYNLGVENAYVMADEFLELLLSNILLNAIEHNPKSKKEVWVDLAESSEYYMISIADNGPGISDVRKKELFDMARRFGGIGLHQAYQIVEKYNGEIFVEDRVDGHFEQGARFVIKIPKTIPVG